MLHMSWVCGNQLESTWYKLSIIIVLQNNATITATSGEALEDPHTAMGMIMCMSIKSWPLERSG